MIIQRTAVRALLLAEPDQLLLSRIHIPDRDHFLWITPGGGMEPGEDAGDTLAREIQEETKLEITEWAGPVWRRRHRFQFRGDTFDQTEFFYLVRTEKFHPDHSGNPAQVEQDIFQEFRWWSLGEMRGSDETFVPRDLATHLEKLIRDGVPAHPITVGI